MLISSVDPVTDEVAAFEELVGSHGGLGGWQTDAMLVHPAAWPIPPGELDGPDAVHRQLVEWLAMLGLRTQTAAEDELAALAAAGHRAVTAADGFSAEAQLRQVDGHRDGAAARLSRSRDG